MNGNASSGMPDDDSAIKVTVPLMIRLLEYAKEDAKNNMALHELTENLIDLSEDGDVLNMKNYEEIVGGEMETPDNTDNTETSDNNTQKVVLEIKLKGK
jgi:hypothetical protein